MIILDENVNRDTRVQLERWRLKPRQIGRTIGREGMSDTEIVSLLHQLHGTTFVTWDQGFKKMRLCHARYCLAVFFVPVPDLADWVRRLLTHPEFSTAAKRMGSVVEVSTSGLVYWRLPQRQMERLPWPSA